MKPSQLNPGKSKPGTQSGFTLIEILAVIAIISLLCAILFPVFTTARQNGQRSSCASNLRQLGLAFTQYREDFDGEMPILTYATSASYRFPNGQNPAKPGQMNALWMHEIYSYIKSPQLFDCPSAEGTYSGGYNWIGAEAAYGFNCYLSKTVNPDLSILKYPAQTPLIADCSYYSLAPDPHTHGTITGDNNNPPAARHLDTVNMTFMDGHVKPVNLEDWTSPFSRNEPGALTDAVWAKYDPRLEK